MNKALLKYFAVLLIILGLYMTYYGMITSPSGNFEIVKDLATGRK